MKATAVRHGLTLAAALAAACGGDSPGPSGGDPPAVAITAPALGSMVQGTVTIIADATDDERVLGVRFFVDDVPVGDDDVDPPFAVLWDTRNAADGLRNLTARARDAGGQTTTSAPVDVTVLNHPAAIELTVTVGGGGDDVDGFSVVVDGIHAGSLAGAGTITLGGLTAGEHSVWLEGVSLWCAAVDPVAVTLAGGAATPLTIPLDCLPGPGGRLLVRGDGEFGVELAWLPVASGFVELLFAGNGSGGVSPDGERLALIANNILLISGIDRSNQTPVATLPFGASHPRWSPDGSTIAFHAGAGVDDIYLIDPDGLNQRRFFGEPITTSRGYPEWSPGGGITYVAYSSATGGVPEGATVWMVNADGSDPTFISDGHSPAWSSDGAKLALTRPAPQGGTDIYVLDVGEWIARRITDGVNGSHPVWSPDGGWLAYARDAEAGGERRELWVARAANGADSRRFHAYYESARAAEWIAAD